MPKTVTIHINDDVYRSFIKRAKAENRSLSNFIETAVKEYIQKCDFANDSEMTQILANERLVGRLRKGSQDVKRKRGRTIS